MATAKATRAQLVEWKNKGFSYIVVQRHELAGVVSIHTRHPSG